MGKLLHSHKLSNRPRCPLSHPEYSLLPLLLLLRFNHIDSSILFFSRLWLWKVAFNLPVNQTNTSSNWLRPSTCFCVFFFSFRFCPHSIQTVSVIIILWAYWVASRQWCLRTLAAISLRACCVCDQILLGSDLTNTISVNPLFLEAGSLGKDCADLSFNAGVETCSVLSFYDLSCRPVWKKKKAVEWA